MLQQQAIQKIIELAIVQILSRGPADLESIEKQMNARFANVAGIILRYFPLVPDWIRSALNRLERDERVITDGTVWLLNIDEKDRLHFGQEAWEADLAGLIEQGGLDRSFGEFLKRKII